MARVRDVEIEEVPEEVRPVYSRFARSFEAMEDPAPIQSSF